MFVETSAHCMGSDGCKNLTALSENAPWTFLLCATSPRGCCECYNWQWGR